MTAIPRYERGNTIKTDIDFKSNDVLSNPYGDTANVSVIRPDGTYLYSAATANYNGTGSKKMSDYIDEGRLKFQMNASGEAIVIDGLQILGISYPELKYTSSFDFELSCLLFVKSQIIFIEISCHAA